MVSGEALFGAGAGAAGVQTQNQSLPLIKVSDVANKENAKMNVNNVDVNALLSSKDIDQFMPSLSNTQKVLTLETLLKSAKQKEQEENKEHSVLSDESDDDESSDGKKGKKAKRKKKEKKKREKRKKKKDHKKDKKKREFKKRDLTQSPYIDCVLAIVEKAKSLKSSGQNVTRTMMRKGGHDKVWWDVIPNMDHAFCNGKYPIFYSRVGKHGDQFKMTWFKDQTDSEGKESEKDRDSDSDPAPDSGDKPKPGARKPPLPEPPAKKQKTGNPEPDPQ